MSVVYGCMSWVEVVIDDISVGHAGVGPQRVSNQILRCKLCGKQFCPKTSQMFKSSIPDSDLDTHGCPCNQQKETSISEVLAFKWVTTGKSHGEVWFESYLVWAGNFIAP